MAWSFGDGFDLYTAMADATNGYWEPPASNSPNLIAGRFAGGQAARFTGTTQSLVKTSGVNDGVHHIVCAIRQTTAIGGTNVGLCVNFLDGAVNQCAFGFRYDGAILLWQGAGGSGTLLATYTGAVPVVNTWYAFEIEINISNTGGYMNVRKNGNPVNDFATATNLNTRNTSNNYANKIILQQAVTGNQELDDFFWRSDASSVAWMGDLRCYTRMPASDASVQFSRVPSTYLFSIGQSGVIAMSTSSRYTSFVAPYDGTVASGTVSFTIGYTGNLKCSAFASSAGGASPTTVLASATVITNPVVGANVITFGSPFAVTKGTTYWVGFMSDTVAGTFASNATGIGGTATSTPYASFPVASPTGFSAGGSGIYYTLNIAVSSNSTVVAEAQQDTLASYVYDSTVGHTDLYNLTPVTTTTGSIVALTTRGYMQKSDAGTRSAAMQLKSGATTVASSTLVLSSSGLQWLYRMDLTDPNTGAAWTSANANAVTIGPTVIS